MRNVGWIERFAAMGTAAQSSVPGLYAWGVTVAPCAWLHGASGAAKLFTAVALAALVLGLLAGDRFGGRLRVPLLWTFVLGSALAWSTAPAAVSTSRIDTQRGLAGMLGWALFATTWSAPALRGQRGAGRLLEDDSHPLGEVHRRGDGLTIVGGAMLAAILQAPGWAAASLERALLVRFVGLAAGLSIIGAATELAVSRHSSCAGRDGRQLEVHGRGRQPDVRGQPEGGAPRQIRLRRATGALLLLGILALAGLLFGFRG